MIAAQVPRCGTFPCEPRSPAVRMPGARLDAAYAFTTSTAFLLLAFNLALVGRRLFLRRGRVLAGVLVVLVRGLICHNGLAFGGTAELTARRPNCSAHGCPSGNGVCASSALAPGNGRGAETPNYKMEHLTQVEK